MGPKGKGVRDIFSLFTIASTAMYDTVEQCNIFLRGKKGGDTM